MKNLIKQLLILAILIPGFALKAQETIGLDNDTLHLKLDLTRGGAISYISKSGTTRNIVNIHDEGRYIQQSYYAGKSLNRQADGQNPSWSPWSWNPIQVGDSYNNRAQILEYSQEGNTLYVKCIPMLWDMNNMPAEAEMEQWTTLEGNVIKVSNKLTCLRTDDIYGEGVSNHQELPAVYPISSLKNLYSYFGQLPFTGAPLSNPAVVNLSSGFWGRYENDMVTENWMAFVDNTQWGIGVYTPICNNFLAGMAGAPGYEATDGSTSYIAPVKSAVLNKNSVFEYDYYLVIGTLDQIRSEIYALKGVQANEWEFTDGPEGWNADPSGGTVEQAEGSIRFNVTGEDPQVSKYVDSWEAGNNRYLWLRIKNETAGDTGVFHFFPVETDPFSVYFPLTPNDTEYRDVLVDLDTIQGWSGDLIINKFRWDPVKNSDEGSVYLDFIRFMEGLIQIRTEGNILEINELGKGLQLYAEELPLLSAIDVDWSVDYPELATIGPTGLLTAVYDGVVTVTATAKDGSGKTGKISIVINDTGQKTAWEFTRDLEGWDKNPNGGTVFFSEGALKFTVEGGDPYVGNNVAPWKVGDLKYLWMRIKNETSSVSGAMYIFPSTGGHDFITYSLNPNDSDYRDIYVDMRTANAWNKNLILNTIRLDPNNDGAVGDIYVDFIRFLNELVEVRSEGDIKIIEGIGNTLQLYAEIMVTDEGAGIEWQVNKPEIATVDLNGLLTSVSEGTVLVTATSKDNPVVTGSIQIAVTVDHSGSDQITAEKLFIYPNPASHTLNIHNAKDIQTMDIITMTGQVVKHINNSGSQLSIDIKSLSPGIYFLKTNSLSGSVSYSRFIIE
ncbi:MAG: Ig-like domain-containing protein [Bacteroidales bacterium]|nr:Ig-like domain-containing protein [Bacteroidales bacterium]